MLDFDFDESGKVAGEPGLWSAAMKNGETWWLNPQKCWSNHDLTHKNGDLTMKHGQSLPWIAIETAEFGITATSTKHPSITIVPG